MKQFQTESCTVLCWTAGLQTGRSTQAHLETVQECDRGTEKRKHKFRVSGCMNGLLMTLCLNTVLGGYGFNIRGKDINITAVAVEAQHELCRDPL